MKIKHFLFLIIHIAVFFISCQHQSSVAIANPDYMPVNRFDKMLFHWIETDDTSVLHEIKSNYSQMFDVLGKALFKTNTADSSDFSDNLINYYSEPTLKSLYKDAIEYYSEDSLRTTKIKEELFHGFNQMKKHFQSMQIPAVYMHVSGLQQNIIVADSLLSCSIDKYMGSDYPLYTDFFYTYQRKNMVPERVAKDCLNVWLKSEYPYQGKESVLLDRMIYEGKIIYILTQTGKDYTYSNLLSLTGEEYNWCVENESALWTYIVEQKHLYNPDVLTTSKYFLPAPAAFISANAPGNLGAFIGYRIVESYIKKTKSTYTDLMNNNDSQEILRKSKYKP